MVVRDRPRLQAVPGSFSVNSDRQEHSHVDHELPAHNEPFIGPHERLDRFASGQRRVLARLHAALQSPSRVIDVYGTLFARAIAPTDASLLELATRESIVHLNYLVARNQASIETDENGVAWYRAR